MLETNKIQVTLDQKAENQAKENGNNNNNNNNSDNTHDNDDDFDCNICLDKAQDAVISLCGHLFCWPCLHYWLELHPTNQLCPVCKAGTGEDKVIPLYGRGRERPIDPRNKPIPPRPRGRRPTPPPTNQNREERYPTYFQPQFQFSTEMGLFPALWGFQFANNIGGHIPTNTRGVMTSPEVQQEFFSRCLLVIGVVMMMSLLLY